MAAINIETKNKEVAKHKTILLFSGGQDSVMFTHLLNPDYLLHIDYGGQYCKKEKQVIQSLIEHNIIDKKKLLDFNFGKWLGSLERDDMIIPSRNAYLILYAANFADTIYLCSVDGDRSTDKDNEFYTKMQELLNHLYAKQHWCEGRKFHVGSPYKHKTKTQVVKLFLSANGDAQALKTSYSCYEGKKQHCGICKACFRKWVSLENNNIDTTGYFKTNPWEAPWLADILPKVRVGKYRGKEDKDIMLALKKHGVV
jgi:7-cyano-7-deazaguanine synthase in queuosine biosynthesis